MTLRARRRCAKILGQQYFGGRVEGVDLDIGDAVDPRAYTPRDCFTSRFGRARRRNEPLRWASCGSLHCSITTEVIGASSTTSTAGAEQLR